MPVTRHLALAASTGLALAALAVTTPAVAEPEPAPAAGRASSGVALRALGTHATHQFDESAAEIVAHDPASQRYFVVNALSGAVDVLDARDPRDPARLREVTVAGLRAADGSRIDEGAQVNSVATSDGLLAVAVESADKVSPGWVAFFRTRGAVRPLAAVRVGVQPDMVVFTPDGRRVVSADEGEPADDFSADPEGSVTVIGVRGALEGRQRASRTARFRAFAGDRLPDGVRVYGPDVAVPPGQPRATRVARNLEPEYVAVEHGSRRAFVTLQENNAIAVVDLRRARVRTILPLGGKDWAATRAGLDASDRDGGVHLETVAGHRALPARLDRDLHRAGAHLPRDRERGRRPRAGATTSTPSASPTAPTRCARTCSPTPPRSPRTPRSGASPSPRWTGSAATAQRPAGRRSSRWADAPSASGPRGAGSSTTPAAVSSRRSPGASGAWTRAWRSTPGTTTTTPSTAAATTRAPSPRASPSAGSPGAPTPSSASSASVA